MTATQIPTQPDPALVNLFREKLRFPYTPAERFQIRDAAGATQQDIAETCGVSTSTVSFWERGICAPKGENRVNYLRVLNALKEVAAEMEMATR